MVEAGNDAAGGVLGSTGGRPRVWGVGALVQAVGDTLAARFGSCVVRGEISGFTRAASGHGYFTLKDEHGQAAIRCAMFRRALSQVEFSPGEGMLVEARGQLAVYEARGELQLVVDGLQRAGAGALYEQFLRLKAKLEAEGLFDAGRKRPLRAFPGRVAVVTSLQAAALRDVLTALARRAPHVEVVLLPCSVQGVEAPAQIVQSLAQLALAHHGGCRFDAAIVCRGGGALEDLWAFNDERVVRAIAACPVPVVSGVGHETDVTLADFAADLRAPTPTAAAELVARDQASALAEIAAHARHLQHRVHQRLDTLSQRQDSAALRLARPSQLLAQHRQQLALLDHRLPAACSMQVQRTGQQLPALQTRLLRAAQTQAWRHQQSLAHLETRLHALDPQRVLERGYAWLSNAEGQPVLSAAAVQPEQAVQAVLADGVLRMRVTDVLPRGPAS
ncbi:exodeoxyribonuclease VII large subunit [Aquabacterium commune]|uniref:Exodeoxyribonuclease 7 large subunit n=1 Tax=Aquabacterium commune TaxID=70586 RepID=A0A4R6REP3_9BURK|nr:exodeoxyribonuclease VII large subunit [Aquabacterium commune]TDP84545.1 exodeoxyribonuclease VII large subunit [Aquabacterium commune]